MVKNRLQNAVGRNLGILRELEKELEVEKKGFYSFKWKERVGERTRGPEQSSRFWASLPRG